MIFQNFIYFHLNPSDNVHAFFIFNSQGIKHEIVLFSDDFLRIKPKINMK